MKSLINRARLAFCGASGTGKTTFASWISQRHQMDYCPIGARSIAAEWGFSSVQQVDSAGRRAEFNLLLMQRKREWEAAHDRFVTCRSHFDNLAYHFIHDGVSLEEATLAAYVEAQQRYTHVVLFDASADMAFCKPGNDPNRPKSLAYHRLYSIFLKALLRRFRNHSQPVLEISHGGFFLRRVEILNFLEK
ncbi:ATP-binding protein [Candidatus Parcubacteria bacterium]|nr:ATP-binding protein [Candidatus Parcubacteria bacterium]